jgi:hypothetical protein
VPSRIQSGDIEDGSRSAEAEASITIDLNICPQIKHLSSKTFIKSFIRIYILDLDLGSHRH